MSRGCRVVDSYRQGGTTFRHPKRRVDSLDAQIELDIDPDDKVRRAHSLLTRASHTPYVHIPPSMSLLLAKLCEHPIDVNFLAFCVDHSHKGEG